MPGIERRYVPASSARAGRNGRGVLLLCLTCDVKLEQDWRKTAKKWTANSKKQKKGIKQKIHIKILKSLVSIGLTWG